MSWLGIVSAVWLDTNTIKITPNRTDGQNRQNLYTPMELGDGGVERQ